VPLVQLRFYGDLNDFLPRSSRQRTLERDVAPHQTVLDVIEACNVPHPEVAVITVDGEAVAGDRHLAGGERVAVYPRFDSVDLGDVERIGPIEPVPRQFALDVHLGRLARLLRLLGFDTWYRNDTDDEELAVFAASEHRMLLTRDTGLLKRKIVEHGALVRSEQPAMQAVEVLRRFGLASDASPFTRCLRCGALLEAVEKAEIERELEPGTRATYQDFSRCVRCGHLYWKGAHHERLRALVASILSASA
jgi:hypothetical protein